MDDIVPIKRGKSLLAVYWSTQMGLSLNIDVSARAFYEAIPVLDFVLKNFRLDLPRPLPDQDRIKVLCWKFVSFFILIELHFSRKCIPMTFFHGGNHPSSYARKNSSCIG
ncbi:hypothetical protein V8G54_001076 [Vigna mungo]|uniref:Uncharacterized protein n=1 Tax=Vigna mungo TaxID=3915 RepID=A0AAQ3S9K5_VIGMU